MLMKKLIYTLIFTAAFSTGGKAQNLVVNLSGDQTICRFESTTLTADATGGQPDYAYLWSNGETTPAITVSPSVQTLYSVTVTDAALATAEQSIDVLVNPVPNVNISISGPLHCINTTVTLTTATTGGTPTYTYAWSGGSTNSSIMVSTVGTYTVTVTDANGCTDGSSVIIVSSPCDFGDLPDTGSGTGTGNYRTYKSDNGPGHVVNPFIKIGSGIDGESNGQPFAAALGDDLNFDDEEGVNHPAFYPGLPANLSVNALNTLSQAAILSVFTDWNNDGDFSDAAESATVSVPAGTNGPIIVPLTPPSNVPLNTLLGQRVRLSTDPVAQTSTGLATNGEVEDYMISVNQCFEVLAEPAPSVCPGATGAIDLTVNGVTGPFTYIWSNGAVTDDLTGVATGTYTVTVSDNNGCTVTATQTIFSETPWTIDITTTEIPCEGVSAMATIQNGAGTYQFQWSNGATGPTVLLTVAGTYFVTVTDDAGCFKPDTFVQNVNALAVTAVANGICNGTQTGTINITVAGGAGPYIYLWTTSETTEDITNLGPGQYCVTVTDITGCTITECFTITELSPISVTPVGTNATCGMSNGSISLFANGGAGGYTYDWEHIAGTMNPQNITGLSSGTYCVTVRDAIGCTGTACMAITNTSIPISTLAPTPVSCFGGSNGVINLTPVGGTGPYQYLWATGATTQDINNLTSGTYCVTVSDINGCTFTNCVQVLQPDVLSVSTLDSDVSCAGQADALIQATATGGVTPYNYFWSNGATTESIMQLNAGVYCLSVTDVNGCTSATCVAISEPPPLILDAQTVPSNCGSNVGAIDLTAMGGVGNYGYDWSHIPGVNNPEDLAGLSPGTYCVTVTDANGCTATSCFTITTNGAIGPTLNVASVLEPHCFGLSDGAIDLTVTGGTPPFTWQWSNGSTVEDQTGISAGAYSVTVTDINNCSFFTEVIVGQPDGITAQTTVTPVSCYGAADGAISVALSGGSGGYAIAWNALPCPTDCQNLPAGYYCATVTDVAGCSATFCEFVTQPLELEAQVNQCDNFAIASASGGVAPYWYAWSTGGNTHEVALMPGNYTLTVTDINGCTTQTEVIAIPNPSPCTIILGRVTYDADGNCITESADPGVPMQMVQAVNSSGDQFLAISDGLGQYHIRVLPGEYTVSLPPATLPQGATVCAPQSYSATLSAPGETVDSVDFAVDLPPCPEMTMSMGINVLRRCFNNNFYWITYCNEGQALADEAFVDVTFDPFIQFVTANRPATQLSGNTWRFQLGQVESGVCGQFYVRVEVSCDAEIGQTHCTSASIYPHAPCTPNPLWSGAELNIRAECTGDSLHFILKNIGTGPMTGALDYIVIEDGIMLTGNGPGLLAGDSMKITFPANGATWRLEADQEPFFPGESRPALSVEGCTNTGTFSTGWIEPYATGAADPWTTSLCTVNTGSYDPNDKRGAPTGYGVQHYVRREDPITYRIRFQNTGTDTAFAVVIRDTLSEWLDPTSFRLGASSHLCHFEFGGENVLVFDFQGIMLPDSNVNVDGSQGFIQFDIWPRDDTPLETDVLNHAAIYFDYNDPVFTNTTQHRIGENFIAVDQWEPALPIYGVSVAPNPIGETALIYLNGDTPKATDVYRLRVYDVLGRLLLEKTAERPQFEVKRSEIPAGVSFFDITKNGAPLGKGKLTTGE